MILVSGARGFVGAALLEQLSAASTSKIIALYNLSEPTATQKAFKNVEWQCVDILDICTLQEAMQGVEKVYHCAAKVSFERGDKKSLFQTNVQGTANMVNAALDAGVKKFLHVSSIATLGRADDVKILNEQSFWEEHANNTVYAQSKYYAEMEVWRAMAEGLNAVIINPSIILGAGDWSKGSAKLIQVAYKEFPFYTQGVNGWVALDDVVKAMILLMDSPISQERYIINSGNYSYQEIFTMMADALNKKAPSIHTPKWLANLIGYLAEFKNLLSKHKSSLSRESARTAMLKCYYDASKFSTQFPTFQYTTIKDCIETMAQQYLRDIQAQQSL